MINTRSSSEERFFTFQFIYRLSQLKLYLHLHQLYLILAIQKIFESLQKLYFYTWIYKKMQLRKNNFKPFYFFRWIKSF